MRPNSARRRLPQIPDTTTTTRLVDFLARCEHAATEWPELRYSTGGWMATNIKRHATMAVLAVTRATNSVVAAANLASSVKPVEGAGMGITVSLSG
jgi:hypothetical protein